MFKSNWLMIWYDGNNVTASVVQFEGGDGPFGKDARDMGLDYNASITAWVSLPDDEIPTVIIDDEEIDVKPVKA